jgi:phenylacetic acid degradation operon negative regulatory protein
MRVVDCLRMTEALGEIGGTLSKIALRKLVEGYVGRAGPLRADWLVRRLERDGLVKREGRGAKATYRVIASEDTDRPPRAPRAEWERPWDKLWRVVTFDLPEVRRKDRQRLWRALRAHRLGLLQRSVWVWPRDVQPILEQIIEAEGVPECFCGFESRRLFLCTDAEVVASAWDFVEITRRQHAYQQGRGASLRQVKTADNPARLAALAREEWQAYDHAFSLDPLLPRELLPKGYQGETVQRQHEEFRQQTRRRLASVAVS